MHFACFLFLFLYLLKFAQTLFHSIKCFDSFSINWISSLAWWLNTKMMMMINNFHLIEARFLQSLFSLFSYFCLKLSTARFQFSKFTMLTYRTAKPTNNNWMKSIVKANTYSTFSVKFFFFSFSFCFHNPNYSFFSLQNLNEHKHR